PGTVQRICCGICDGPVASEVCCGPPPNPLQDWAGLERGAERKSPQMSRVDGANGASQARDRSCRIDGTPCSILFYRAQFGKVGERMKLRLDLSLGRRGLPQQEGPFDTFTDWSCLRTKLAPSPWR